MGRRVHERWLSVFGVPAIGARSLGFYRAIIGFSFLLVLLLVDPITAVPLDVQRTYSPLVSPAWVHAFAASQSIAVALEIIGVASALLFALGLWARTSYFVLVAVLLTHATMLLVRRGVHDWDLPMAALLGLLVVPWSAAPPLTTLWRTRDEDGPPQRAYGFAIWLPGLAIGLAFAAAAYAKLHTSGLAWITGGAVRYHFVDDSRNAPFGLGLWVATHPDVSVVLSAFAILVEALFVLVVFFPGWRTRAGFGLVGVGLLAGFYVFQGVHWFPWWILFVAFLPWNRHASGADAMGSKVPRACAAVVAVLIGAQLWASYRAIEIEPLLSNYPMYAITYESPEHFELAQARYIFEASGADITERVDGAAGRRTLEAVVERSAKGLASDELAPSLAEFQDRYARLYGTAPPAIDVFRIRKPFDWTAGRYLPEVRDRLGRVGLDR